MPERAIRVLAGALLAVLPLSLFAASPLTSANAALQAGKADEAISLLSQTLKTEPNNAEANNLLCRTEYILQRFDAAAGHCEKAIAAAPQNALYHLWLGRITGERAGRANFLSAFSMAKKTREEFETAVRLDPRDAEALADLCEFDKDAPGAVGGGIDKAEGVAKQLDSVDPARAHECRAQIADKQKDFATAERELKAAVAAGNHPAFQWMALASFYRHHERWDEMEAAVKSGQAAAARDKHSAVALYNGASTLARANRQTDIAIKLFETYLASPDKTEEAPAFEALVRLAKLRKAAGDNAGAAREKAAALSLAHEYKPAQELRL